MGNDLKIPATKSIITDNDPQSDHAVKDKKKKKDQPFISCYQNAVEQRQQHKDKSKSSSGKATLESPKNRPNTNQDQNDSSTSTNSGMRRLTERSEVFQNIYTTLDEHTEVTHGVHTTALKDVLSDILKSSPNLKSEQIPESLFKQITKGAIGDTPVSAENLKALVNDNVIALDSEQTLGQERLDQGKAAIDNTLTEEAPVQEAEAERRMPENDTRELAENKGMLKEHGAALQQDTITTEPLLTNPSVSNSLAATTPPDSTGTILAKIKLPQLSSLLLQHGKTGNNQKIVINLEPQNLGSLNITINLNKQNQSILIKSDNNQTAELLQKQLPSLRQTLTSELPQLSLKVVSSQATLTASQQQQQVLKQGKRPSSKEGLLSRLFTFGDKHQ